MTHTNGVTLYKQRITRRQADDVGHWVSHAVLIDTNDGCYGKKCA